MVEANELFEGWADEPPTNVLLNGIVRGFAGKGATTPSREQRALETGGAITNVTDADLIKLSVEAGPALPVQRTKDIGLPKKAPVFDMLEMRKRNTDVIVRTTLRNKVVGRK